MPRKGKKKKKYSIRASKSIRKNLILCDSTAEDVQFNVNAESTVATFRKQILKAGTYKHPQHIEKEVTFDDEYFDELIRAFDDKAIDNVAVIVGTHDEEQTEKVTGRVVGLEKETDVGLYANMEIAGEDIIEKIETKLSDGKGVIDEVSVGIEPVTTDEGVKYKCALYHVAIVTHGFYKGMDSFERLAASIKKSNKDAKFLILHAQTSLQDQIQNVRTQFHDQLPFGVDYWDYYISETYDDYLIVEAYEKGKYYRFNYSEDSEGNITFSEGVEVEVQYVEVSEMDLIAELKKNGVDVKDMDELKAKLEADNEGESTAEKILASVKSAINPDESDSIDSDKISKIVASLVESNNSLVASNKEVMEFNQKLQASMVDKDAEHAVSALVDAGKVIPAKKDDFIALYKANQELFASLTKDMPKVITTGAEGEGSGDADNEGNQIDAVAEADRIVKAYVKTGDNKEA